MSRNHKNGIEIAAHGKKPKGLIATWQVDTAGLGG
jgi:hypothetical protein